MLEVLHDTFAWRQAKIVVVPRLMLVVNFLCELVRWPSRWRDFWATLNPEDAKAAAGGGSWRLIKQCCVGEHAIIARATATVAADVNANDSCGARARALTDWRLKPAP